MDQDRERRTKEKSAAAGTSVAAAVLLTAMKLVVGLATGSLGILAEAAHSALDLVAAVLTFFAVRVSDRPADADHPYGHGKVENLSALAETVLLLLTCGWIIVEAVRRLAFERVEVDPSLWAFATLAISIVVDFSRSRVLARAAAKYQSQALEADALHFSTDIWSSAVAMLGLGLVWIGQHVGLHAVLGLADPLAALGIAVLVIGVSIRLGRRTVDALLDTAPPGLAARIASGVATVDGVRRVLRTRVRGSEAESFVDLQVAVAGHLSVEEGEAILERAREAALIAAPKADVVVHAIPDAEDAGVLERILAVAARGRFAVHNITTHVTREGTWIDLDLEVPPETSFDRAHGLATDLEDRLRGEFGRADGHPPAGGVVVAGVNVHIEPRAEVLLEGEELEPAERARVTEVLERVCALVPQARGCFDVVAQRLPAGIYLSFRLRLDHALPVAQVHGVTEEVENRLRRELPGLGRVVVHAEPQRAEELPSG